MSVSVNMTTNGSCTGASADSSRELLNRMLQAWERRLQQKERDLDRREQLLRDREQAQQSNVPFNDEVRRLCETLGCPGMCCRGSSCTAHRHHHCSRCHRQWKQCGYKGGGKGTGVF